VFCQKLLKESLITNNKKDETINNNKNDNNIIIITIIIIINFKIKIIFIDLLTKFSVNKYHIIY